MDCRQSVSNPTVRSVVSKVALALMVAAVSGCQLWLKVDSPQCTSDQTCVKLLGVGAICGNAGVCKAAISAATDAGSDADARAPLPSRWSCLREPPKDFVPNSDKTLQLRMDVVDVVTLQVPDGLVAAACMPGDVECMQPVASNVQPGSDGFLEFQLPYGFEGFITVDAPSYVPSLSYDSKPYTDSITTSGPAIVTPAVLSVISADSGTPNDPNNGLVFVETRDCNDAAADGVQLDSVDDTMPFYFDGALPSHDLTATAISNQLGAGREPRALGGYPNMKPGYTTFQATLPDTGDIVGRLTVQVRAGHITYVRMHAGY
jgi:hypothetical protein